MAGGRRVKDDRKQNTLAPLPLIIVRGGGVEDAARGSAIYCTIEIYSTRISLVLLLPSHLHSLPPPPGPPWVNALFCFKAEPGSNPGTALYGSPY